MDFRKLLVGDFNPEMTIETKRLVMFPMSNESMKLKIERETNLDLRLAYYEMYEGALAHPDTRIWHAIWCIRLKGEKTVIGDFAFKGLGKDGMIEIGYGMQEPYQNKGYMTEAVNVICRWASVREEISRIEAEVTKDNLASIRVLEKAGFVPTGKNGAEGPRYVFVSPKEFDSEDLFKGLD